MTKADSMVVSKAVRKVGPRVEASVERMVEQKDVKTVERKAGSWAEQSVVSKAHLMDGK